MRAHDQSEPVAHADLLTRSPHLWRNTSSSGCPVLDISVCRICARKATTQDLRMWRSRERLRAFNARKAERV